MLRKLLLTKLLRPFSKHPALLLVAAVIYVLIPIDLIPEGLMGFLGFWDDLIVSALAVILSKRLRKLRDSEAEAHRNAQ